MQTKAVRRMLISITTRVDSVLSGGIEPVVQVTYLTGGDQHNTLQDAIQSRIVAGDCCRLTACRLDGKDIGTLRDLGLLR